MIVLHVILALSSLVSASINVFKPTNYKLKTSYGLAMGTLASGVLLVIINHAPILRTCLTGIVFFGIVAILNESTRKRLTIKES